MKKTYLLVGGVSIILSVIVYFYITTQTSSIRIPNTPHSIPALTVQDLMNATFTIDNTPITLRNGSTTIATLPDSASVTTVRYFGNELFTDLDQNDTTDAIFLITSNSGGSGTFFYVVALLQTDTGTIATPAYFIGDRIAPQPISFDTSSNTIAVNYADRPEGAAMSDPTSEGKTLYLQISNSTLIPAISPY